MSLCTFDSSRKEGETNENKGAVTVIYDPCGPLRLNYKQPFDAYMEQALHQLVLFLSALCTALSQLDDHTHVTRGQDGLHTLDQLIEQPRELKEGEN